MDKKKHEHKTATAGPSSSTTEDIASKNRLKYRGRKRKRVSSSSESDDYMNLPENILETERNLHASAVRNNLDDTSVKKILKKVVENDHVQALVKLREEEEGDSGSEDKNVAPKLTRAKAKELKKVSSQSAPWNLENLELTPINHIPVKTRPDVKALITQELPEDEDDDEYEPTNEDAMSDDEHEQSCSDIDSQPRTPATPARLYTPSPNVHKDGPFKVPQDVSSARRKLVIDEEVPTIALRTRSKLSLSTTTIEHIESEFVPPDDIPPQVDGLWNQFLNECFSASQTHEDDDDDPEYNAAADADALEEDEEALRRSLIKISKKELNDLVTELFNIMPSGTDEELAIDNITSNVPTNNTLTEAPRWEGKVEALSDEELANRPSQRLVFEENRDSPIRFSIGKSETEDTADQRLTRASAKVKESMSSVKADKRIENTQNTNDGIVLASQKNKSKPQVPKPPTEINICISEREIRPPAAVEEQNITSANAPQSLRNLIEPRPPETVHVQLDSSCVMTEQQVMILEQQIRQHVQLAATNFLQLFVHPLHWAMAPAYKEYLTSLDKLAKAHDKSVVKVCNLEPALELVTTWENTVADDTPQNAKMVEFINDQVERCRRRYASNSLHVGDFPEMFKQVVANSSVFLYPYLLPAMPYRADNMRRTSYLKSEDHLIVLGLDQFQRYIADNPFLFRRRNVNPRHRWGLGAALQLVTKHMFPWLTAKALSTHVANARANRDRHSPIYNYFANNEMTPVKHTILPFNPTLTLYDQPEHEMPRLWVRYLAKSSKRFKSYLSRRHHVNGVIPQGMPVESVTSPPTVKKPLPLDFTKHIPCGRPLDDPSDEQSDPEDTAKTTVVENVFKFIETSTGAHLMPINMITVNSTQTVTTPAVTNRLTIDGTSRLVKMPQVTKIEPYHPQFDAPFHCTCCTLLRSIVKRQTVITDYFKRPKDKVASKTCYCSDIKHPRISNKLKLLLNNFKNNQCLIYNELERRLAECKGTVDGTDEQIKWNIEELISVTSFLLKLVSRSIMSKKPYLKIRIKKLFTNFDASRHDPMQLAKDLFNAFGVEMVDLYMDFLEFLTTEQVDKLQQFKEYFTRNCVKDLMEKVVAQVQDVEARARILSQLRLVYTDRGASACHICTCLLTTMPGYSQLAEYTFSLFPHTKHRPISPVDTYRGIQSQGQKESSAADEITAKAQNTIDYEDDSSDEVEDAEAIDMPVIAEESAAEPILDDRHTDGVAIAHKESSLDPHRSVAMTNKAEESAQELRKGVAFSDKAETSSLESQNSIAMSDKTKKSSQKLSNTVAICDKAEKSSLQPDKVGAISDKVEKSSLEPNNGVAISDKAEESSIKPGDTRHNSVAISDTAVTRPIETRTMTTIIKIEPDTTMDIEENQIGDTKPDIENSSTYFVITLEEDIKDEPPDSVWKRDEDKLILEVLQENLTPEERKDKTIAEILEEKNVFGLIAEKIPQKSMDDIRKRVVYILSLLVLSESSRKL